MLIFLFLECFFTYNLLLLSTVKTWTWTKSAFGLLASFWPLGLFVVCLLYGFFSIPFIAISDCSRIFPCFFILFFYFGVTFSCFAGKRSTRKAFSLVVVVAIRDSFADIECLAVFAPQPSSVTLSSLDEN